MSSTFSARRERLSGARLPLVLTLGFVGPFEEPLDREALRNFLSQQAAMRSHVRCAITCLSPETLPVAEACMEQGIALRLLLPASIERLRQDFGVSHWPRAEAVMQKALSMEALQDAGPLEDGYYQGKLEVVMQSQIVVTMGQHTAEEEMRPVYLTFATEMGRPVLTLDRETGRVHRTNQEALLEVYRDEELLFLNRLPSPLQWSSLSKPSALAETWMRKLDENAVRVAPQVVRLAALPIICTAMAAFASGIAPRMHSSSVWLGAGAALGITAGLLPVALRLAARQAMWVRVRTAAEVTRSVLALWHTPAMYTVVGHEILREMGGMLASLNYLKSVALQAEQIPVEEFKQHYLNSRVRDQRDYFGRQAAKAAAKGKRYRNFATACTVLAITMSAWAFLVGLWLGHGSGLSGGRWVPMIAAALFQAATVAGALVVVHDCDRRQKRYQELQRMLSAWETELRALHTWTAAMKLTSRIERALMIELLEWRSLLQNRKMPRN